MSITFGTPNNSGNLATSSGTTRSHTTNANSKCLVAIITGYDSSATDSVVSSVTFGGVALTAARYYRSASGFVAIYYLKKPPVSTTANVVLTMGGANTDLQITIIDLISATATTILFDSYAESTLSTAAHSVVVNPARANSIAVGGIVALVTAVTALSVTSGTEITGSEVDMGSQCVGCATAPASGTTVTITWSKTSAVASYALLCTFYEEFSPTIALNSPADAATVQSNTPVLKFIGTDANTMFTDLEYNVQVDTVNTFNSISNFGVTIKKSMGLSAPLKHLTDDANYVYVGNYSQTGIVYRFAKSDFSLHSAINLGLTNFIRAITNDTDYVYVGIYTTGTSGKVIRINKSDFTTTVTKTFSEDNIESVTTDSNYVYVGHIGLPGSISRINKSDFSTTVTKTLAIDDDNCYALTNDANYIYAALIVNGGRVARINKSDFNTTLTINLSLTIGDIYAITDDANYVYVGNFAIPAKLVRIAKSDFATFTVLSLPTGENKIITLTNDTDYVYAGLETTPAKVVRVNKSDFTTTITKTFDTGENYVPGLTNDSNYLYGTISSDLTGKYFRIDKFLPIIDKLSSVPDPGFLDSPDAGDTHPFDNNTEIQYTIQAANALTYGTTYYWRVRTLDYSGSQIWSAWSSTRSFTPQSANVSTISLGRPWMIIYGIAILFSLNILPAHNDIIDLDATEFEILN
jgi:hypothetical protein